MHCLIPVLSERIPLAVIDQGDLVFAYHSCIYYNSEGLRMMVILNLWFMLVELIIFDYYCILYSNIERRLYGI